jgi:flagellar hook-associated protein 1 FlgK
VSEISALQIGLSALLAQRRGLDVTGHNIANANTEGYSRQRVDLAANGGPIVPALFSRWTGSGLGVTVTGVSRAYDAFLDARSMLEHGSNGSLTRTHELLGRVESLFNEPSDNGVQHLLDDYWAAWRDVANNPGDNSGRVLLVERAKTLAGAINKASAGLTAISTASIEQLSATVAGVNTTAQNIALLNAKVQTAAASGIAHQDLLDQRDVLVRKLADKLGSTSRIEADGTIDVFLGGGAIVRGNRAEALKVDTSTATVAVQWARDGSPAGVTGGEVSAFVDTVNDMIPRYLAGLDAIATNLRDGVNSVHAALSGTIAVGSQDLTASGALSFGLRVNGTTYPDVSLTGADWSGVGGAAALQAALQTALDTSTGTAGVVTATVTGGNGTPLTIALAPGNPADSVNVATVSGNPGLGLLLSDVLVGADGVGGRQFFTGTNSATLAVAPDVLASPSAVGAAASTAGPLDGSGALRVAALGQLPAGVNAIYRAYITGLGVEGQSVAGRLQVQAEATSQADNARNAQSGVNLDEEMTNMMMYQHAYSAASRFITVIDDVLATLVERTGLVGR